MYYVLLLSVHFGQLQASVFVPCCPPFYHCSLQPIRLAGLRVGSCLALTYIRQMNRVKARNDLCHDDSTIDIVPGIIIIIIIIIRLLLLFSWFEYIHT